VLREVAPGWPPAAQPIIPPKSNTHSRILCIGFLSLTIGEAPLPVNPTDSATGAYSRIWVNSNLNRPPHW